MDLQTSILKSLMNLESLSPIDNLMNSMNVSVIEIIDFNDIVKPKPKSTLTIEEINE